MSIARDDKNPSITIIDTPQGKIRFNFGIGNGIETGNKFGKVEALGSDKRIEVEAALDATFNRPSSSIEAQRLQGNFNSTIIATQKGTPLDVATSSKMTPENSGGGVMAINQKNQEAVLLLNVDVIKQTPYKTEVSGDMKQYPMTRVQDQIDHELFHYVDQYLDNSNSNNIDPNIREARALWFVNQIMKAENVSPRINYEHNITGEIDRTGPQLYTADNRLQKKTIPGLEKEDGEHKLGPRFGEPSMGEHRTWPHNMQKQVTQIDPALAGHRDTEAESKYAKDLIDIAILKRQQIQRGEVPVPEQDPQREIVVQKIMHNMDNHDRNATQNGVKPPLAKEQTSEPDFGRR
ncbi:MAG: hypothetical protein WBL28_08020 [Methylotenera sp.]